MESLDDNKWAICRICLRNCSDKMHKIFTEEAEVEDLVGKIRECGGITLDNFDQLPDSICCKCLLLLQLAYKFRTLCQKSHQQLLNLSDVTSEGIEEYVTTNNGKVALAVKLEVESTEEEDNEVLDYIIESVGSDEMDAEAIDDIKVLEAYIDLAESRQNDDVEYLLQDEIENIVISDQSNMGESKIELNHNESPFYFVDDADTDEVAIADNEVKNSVTIVKQRKRKRAGVSGSVESKLRNEQKHRRVRKTKKSANQILTISENEFANFICFDCGNIYSERYKLTLHSKIHNKEKPHECEICHKRFAQTPQLSRHMNSHTGSRPYKCKFCTSSFADPSTCIKHERIHTNERPYKCDTCNKAFSYSNVLKVHIMTHTGEKPFSCEYCEKKFAQLHHKKAHERTHNGRPVQKM